MDGMLGLKKTDATSFTRLAQNTGKESTIIILDSFDEIEKAYHNYIIFNMLKKLVSETQITQTWIATRPEESGSASTQQLLED